MTNLISTLKNCALVCTILITTNQLQAQTSTLKVDAGDDINHCIGNFTDLKASVTGGVEPYIIVWTPDVEISATDVENPVVSPMMHTVYRVVVTDATGAIARDELKVRVSPKPNVFTNGIVTIQSGESITLMADASGGTPPYAYSWNPTYGLTGSNSSSPSASPKYSTVYTVVVRDSKGCENSAQAVVNISGEKTGILSSGTEE